MENRKKKKINLRNIFCQQYLRDKKGVSLFLVVLVLAVASFVLFSLVSLSLSQIKIIWKAGDSAVAFFAADTGIEQALYRTRKTGNFANFSGAVGEAVYDVFIETNGEGNGVVVKSIGSYRGTKRAIESIY